MRTTLKKALSLVAIMGVLSQDFFLWASVVFAAWDLTISALKTELWTISDGGYILADPDTSAPSTQQGFRFDVQWKNSAGESIKKVFVNLSLGDNSGFSYDGINLKARVNGADTTNPLPSSVYSAGAGIVAELTTDSVPTVDDQQALRLAPVGSAQNIFVSKNISTYQNNATVSITGLTTADGTAVSSPTIHFTIYANVKPHIIDSYFEKADGSATTTQIQGSSAEAINFVVKVKDSNGSADIAGGAVTADLSALGLGSAEALSYVSSNGNTATFKKTGIVTSASLGTKNIPISGIHATDMEWHQNDRNDTYFWSVDKTSDVSLTVVVPAAPALTLDSTSDTKIGGSLEPSSIVTFHADQNGETKVVLGGDSLCSSGGTILQDWSGSGSYTAASQKAVTINASSLSEWTNTINLCVRSTAQVIGSLSVSIEKKTTLPTLSSLTYAPSSVTTGDASATFSCDRDGEARVELGGATYGAGTFVSSGAVNAWGSQTLTIINSALSNGANTLKAYCRDLYGNTNTGSTITINKVPPTPAMTGTASLVDSDIDLDGLDGRDVSITWDTSAWVGFGSYFESYRLYLLPSGTSYNSSTQTAIWIIPSSASGSFTGASTLTKDSLGNALVSGASYIACVAIMGTSGLLGTQVCSGAATLTADTVSHPSILSARFTSDTNLEVTTDATLDTTLSTHSGGLLTYTVGGNSKNPTGVASVSGKKINFTIPSLGSKAAVGTITLISTGSIHAAGGGYNNWASPAISITDAQSPTISAFSKSTAATYGNFYKGTISVSYSFDEAMAIDGSTRIDVIRTGGNADSASHQISFTTSAEATAGSHNRTINLDSLSLVSGTTYELRLAGKDIAGNSASSQIISSIGYDTTGPAAPTLSNAPIFGTLTPTLAWVAALDDGGNGSGIQTYKLTVYSGNSCTPGAVQTYPSIAAGSLSYTLSSTLPYDKSAYSWTLQATDNMGNTGSVSLCGAFAVDTSVPTISSTALKDTTINSSSWAKIGDAGSIQANIINTDSAHIWADLSALTGNSGDSHVACASPTSGVACTYLAGVVTYNFTIGSVTQNVARTVSLAAQNTLGLNDTSASISITVDSTAPSITAGTITSPNGGEIWGGTTRVITWNSAQVTDAWGVASLTLSYSADGGGNWNTIASVPNTGSYAWSIGSLVSWANYLVKITAVDNAGNTASDQSNAVFAIDLSAPTVGASAITSPNGSEVWKGWVAHTITWNTSLVTDNIALATNPVKLEYSPDNGASWNTIIAATANNGTYTWTPGSLNIGTAKIRLTATDIAGNTASDVSDSVFAIDSTAPSLSISYAWGGGSTPQNGRKINSTGIEISAGATDSYLQTISYVFRNATDNLSYVDGSGWMGGNASNILCTDGTNFGTANNCANPAAISITPTIENGKTYELVVTATDEAGNTTNSITHTYVGDTVAPTLSVSNNTTGGYFSWALNITGTSSDAGSTVGSVTVRIQKGSQYWDGSNWISTPTDLLATTSDNYAHFSYAFSAPILDADLSSYQITVNASDKAYKTPNTSTSSFTATLDKNGPTIASDVFTFSTTPIRKGGTSMTVTWDPSKVTSAGAGLATNPITLAYNFTGTVVTIASGLPNSGSYSFTLPIVDTNAGHIIIGATDTLGNAATNIGSTGFVIDSTPPSISSVETADFDADGQIDGFIVTTSENTNTTGINLAEFSVSNGITLASHNAYDMSTVTKIELHFAANYGNTASLPTLSYSGTSIADIAGNALVAFSNRASTDKAAPRLLSSAIHDSNANGKIDSISAVFSEPMSATTDTSAWSLVGALPGVAISGVSISGNTANITLSEPSSPNTSTGGMSLNFTANANYHDIAGNMAGSLGAPLTIADQAAPIVISARTQDNTGNGKMDTILVTFSEPISGTDAGWTISGLATGASYAGGGTISSNTLTLPFNETSLTSDSGVTPTLSYTPGNIVDASGNSLATFSGKNTSDGVSPVVLSRTTLDTDGNGKIDKIILHTSETLSGSASSASVTVASHTVNSLTLSGSDIQAVISEGANVDTAEIPAVQLTSAGNLEDASGNGLTPESSATASIDGTGPIIATARYDFGATAGVSDDIVYVTFSEPINTSTLAVSDFIISGGGTLGSATLTNVSTTSAEIHLAADSTALTPGTSKISLTTASVDDANGNHSPTESSVNRITVLPPVILSEIMWSQNGSLASQYIELHNLGASSIDVSGWKIRNAGGDGVDITLPGGATITAGGFYLITKNTPATGGSVLAAGISANYVSNTLALASSQNNLSLENASSVVFDRAKANPWSAGSGSAIVSMERNAVAGAGTSDSDWHSAVVNRSSFTDWSALGTPGNTNEIDGTAPVLTTASVIGTLYNTTSNDFAYSVSDDYGVNWTTFSPTLERWNGSTWTATGTITASTGSTTTLHTVAPTYGKYRTTIHLSDNSGNAAIAQYVYYVDTPQIAFGTGASNIGNLSPSAIVNGSPITITVKTVGAGVSIASLGDSAMTLSGGVSETLGSWNGTKGYGIDYSVTTPSGSGNILASGTPKSVGQTMFTDSNISPDSDGNLKTYTISLRFGGKIDEETAAGVYKAITNFSFDFSY